MWVLMTELSGDGVHGTPPCGAVIWGHRAAHFRSGLSFLLASLALHPSVGSVAMLFHLGTRSAAPKK